MKGTLQEYRSGRDMGALAAKEGVSLAATLYDYEANRPVFLEGVIIGWAGNAYLADLPRWQIVLINQIRKIHGWEENDNADK